MHTTSPRRQTQDIQQRSSQSRSTSLTVTQLLQIAQAEWRKVLAPNTNALPAVNRDINLTSENMRSNFSWGDKLEEKSDNTIRVYMMNVNGFSLDRRGGQFDNYCRVLKEVQADIACGQEHNLDTTKSTVRSILHNTTQQHWKRVRSDFCSSPLVFENLYKPGGTFIMSVGNITSRVSLRYQDKWGRWSSQTFQGRAGKLLTVISAYQVVTDTPAKGTTTAAAQQQSLLIQAQDSLMSPRTAFRRDLMKYIRQCRALHHEILLTGDFNETVGNDPAGMSRLMIECNLLNVMTRLHPSLPLPTTYARGHRCLDYVLATESVASAVVKAGYESFNAKFPTDHRSYFVDISISDIFGIQLQPLAKYEPRILQSTNLNQVTAYLEKKHELLCNHNVFERIQQLTRPGNRHCFAERLDTDVLEASLAAEQTITRYGEPQWSVELASARKKAQVLTKRISMFKTRIDNATIIQEEWLAIDTINPMPSTLRECTTLLKETKKDISDIVQQSFQRREHELRKKIEALANSAHTSDRQHATMIRRLQKAEAIKALFRKLKSLQQIHQKSGVTRIEIPSPPEADPKTCTEWTQIDIPDEVAYHLRVRNQRHFGQAAGTPFTVPPLSTHLGFDGQGDAADTILRGEHVYEGNDPHVQLLIQHLEHIASTEALPIQPTIKEKEFIGKLKAWRETTTTSPSGLHLGHFKALISRHKYSVIPEDEDGEHRVNRERLNRIQQDLLDVHLKLLNYALERGYSFLRWQKVANTILFKDPGVIKIHRTRVIHLYEADYNLAMGLKWRAAVYQAEALKSIHNGQFGSRPRRNAIDPVFIEELQLEMSRLTRKTIAQTNYDATACYDRIIPNLATLASRRFGVPQTVTSTNARTLQGANYYVRTDLGVANEGYKHSEEAPIFGTGQGSGNSPAIWCFISSLLYDCYDKLAVPATYCTPDSSHRVDFGMVGFVDDSNGQTNTFMSSETQTTKQTTKEALQHNAQHWADLLGATGGALELSKCSVHVAHWAFTMQGAPVLQTDKDSFSNIVVRDPTTGQVNRLQYLSPYAPHKTLGHYKEPAGTQRRQFTELQTKSNTITSFLQRCSLTHNEAWTYYYACYLPALSYPLANSYFSKKQLEKVQRKAMSLIIPKCGYNRNTKKEILYGPLHLGGANLRHLYDQQGLGQLTLFLRHWRVNTEVGQLLKCVVAWAQYSVGMELPILEYPKDPLPHLEAKWLASLRDYLAATDAGLYLNHTGCIPIEREHDGHLMQWIVQSTRFTPNEITRLNYCRLYLNAVTLSDLTNTNGDILDFAKLNGAPSLFSSYSHWMAVNQDRPSETEWQLWKRANRLWSAADGTLHQALGSWTRTLNQRRIRHFAYQHHRTLYIRYPPQDKFLKCRQVGRAIYAETNHMVVIRQIPPQAQPADVSMVDANKWRVVHLSHVSSPHGRRLQGILLLLLEIISVP